MNILLVEDDITLHRNIVAALEADGFFVDGCYDGAFVIKTFQKKKYELVILDINLPGKNGFQLCKAIREIDKVVPILFLTAFNDLEDKIEGFNAGADDYLTKPFFIRELLLRVHALIKRSNQEQLKPRNEILHFAGIQLDDLNKSVLREDQKIELTPREFQILKILLKNPGEIVSKVDLLKEIWGSSFDGNSNTIEVYINFLRKKIDKPFQKNTIRTKIGFGYYLVDE
jgi:DNA-binding response OmpR family regulator